MKRLTPKKILFITSTFPVNENDSLAPWIGSLVRKIRDRGNNIEVFAPSYSGTVQSHYFGVPVFRFRYAPAFLEKLVGYEGALMKLKRMPFFYFISIFYLIFGLIGIMRKVREEAYDVIHVNWPFPHGIFGILAKRLTSAKLVLTFYGAEFSLANRIPFGRTILSLIIRNANSVVAISSSTRSKILSLKKIPVEIIPLASPISITEDAKKTREINKAKKILFVGRLIERKGVQFLIGAMPHLLSEFDVRLEIVGEGSLHLKLKKQVESMKLENKVFFYGKVPEEKLKEFYQSCDLFVLPAITDTWGDTEGLGVVILEAMSFQKPIVASRVGGITDVVKDGKTGILVPEKDSFALSKAIMRILEDKNLASQLGKEGFKYMSDKFSWDSILKKIIKIYNQT